MENSEVTGNPIVCICDKIFYVNALSIRTPYDIDIFAKKAKAKHFSWL